MRGKATRGRKRMHLLSDLIKRKYVALKSWDRKEWQKLKRKSYTCFSADYLKKMMKKKNKKEEEEEEEEQQEEQEQEQRSITP